MTNIVETWLISAPKTGLYNELRQSRKLHTVKNYLEISEICILKGQSNEIFDLHFFHYLILPGALTNGLSYFRFRFRFRRAIRILCRFEKTNSPGYDTPGRWLAGVWYPMELCFGGFFIDSLRFDTPQRGMILRGDWLAGASFPAEIASPGYHTPGRLKNLNNSRILNQNQEYFTHWSVAQVGSNYEKEKKAGWKSRWTVPLKRRPKYLTFAFFQAQKYTGFSSKTRTNFLQCAADTYSISLI